VQPETQSAYTGELASPNDICGLADEYRKAAHLLLTLGRRADPMSRAPYRLSAIHAIELYLSALLLCQGYEPARIRGMQHDLATRAELAIACGLQLKKRTTAHLSAMTGKREYLVTRYGPEMTTTISQINRLTAILEEIASKVTQIMHEQTAEKENRSKANDRRFGKSVLLPLHPST
jgi:hypothetical protein